MNKTEAIRAMLDGEICIADEVRYRFSRTLLYFMSAIPEDRIFTEIDINKVGEFSNWAIYPYMKASGHILNEIEDSYKAVARICADIADNAKYNEAVYLKSPKEFYEEACLFIYDEIVSRFDLES